MSEGSNQSRDQSQVAFFIGSLCQEADMVYRFGYALTLSSVGATKLVLETYSALLGQLNNMLHASSQEIRIELMKAAWHVFQGWSDKFDETDSAILDFLHSMTPDVRVVLVVVDALGFKASEAAEMLELKEVELRRYLASGRRHMLSYQN